MTPLRPRQPLVVVALAAVAGVFGAELWELPLWWPLAVSGLLAVPLFTKWRSTWLCAVFATATFFSLHTLWHYNSPARGLAQEFARGPSVVNAVGIVWSDAGEAEGLGAAHHLPLHSQARVARPRGSVELNQCADRDALGGEGDPAIRRPHSRHRLRFQSAAGDQSRRIRLHPISPAAGHLLHDPGELSDQLFDRKPRPRQLAPGARDQRHERHPALARDRHGRLAGDRLARRKHGPRRPRRFAR